MAKTKFRPLHDRVVVKRIDAEEKTKGGISFPTAPRKAVAGRNHRVGPGGRARGPASLIRSTSSRRPRAVRQMVGQPRCRPWSSLRIDALDHDAVVQRTEFGFGHDVSS